jgi:hypothetical protein
VGSLHGDRYGDRYLNSSANISLLSDFDFLEAIIRDFSVFILIIF